MDDDADAFGLLRAWLSPAKDAGHFRVEGRHAVRALLESDFEVVALADDASAPDPLIQSLAHRVRGPSLLLDRGTLADLLGFDFHRGVVAAALKPAGRLAEWVAGRTTARLAVLERLADPGNVGTVIRCAAAFGFDAVVCSAAGASPYHSKAVRASGTALFRLPVFVEADWRQILAETLPNLPVAGTTVSAEATPLADFAKIAPESLAVVFGSEAEGLSPELLEHCDHWITIPHSDRVESLNVGAAAAIVLHALQRGGPG